MSSPTEIAEGSAEKHMVRVHIERKPYESPTPTTGEALYQLGHVPHGHELFREVVGNAEDEFVPRSSDIIHLKQDEHFYFENLITIIVNTRKRDVEKGRISFSQVVSLAFDPVPANTQFVVKYSNGRHNASGSLTAEQSVKVKEGMIFNVSETYDS